LRPGNQKVVGALYRPVYMRGVRHHT
jgi:hypothetical protein